MFIYFLVIVFEIKDFVGNSIVSSVWGCLSEEATREESMALKPPLWNLMMMMMMRSLIPQGMYSVLSSSIITMLLFRCC